MLPKYSTKKSNRRSQSKSRKAPSRKKQSKKVRMPKGYGQPSQQSAPRREKYKAVPPPRNTGIGAFLGNMVEPGLGGILGGAAESLFTSLIGSGDYSEQKVEQPITTNTIMGVQTPAAAQVPIMHKEKGFTRVTHREYVQDIPMTVNFSVLQYAITPSNPALFPWLSTIAANFSEYCFQGVVFEYVSLSADAIAGTNAGLGSVTQFIDYDVYASPPANKTVANNAMFAVSNKPSVSAMCPMECEPEISASRILRTGRPGTQSSDKHFYQYGNMYVITQGGANSYPGAGELWVTYDVDFFKPVVGEPSIRALHVNTAPTNASPLALAAKGIRFNNFGAIISGNSIVFPTTVRIGDAFMIIHYTQGGANTVASIPPTFTSSAFVFADFSYLPAPSIKVPELSNVDKRQVSITTAVLVYSNVPATITAGSYVSPGVSLGDLWVLQIPTDMITTPNVAQPSPGLSSDESKDDFVTIAPAHTSVFTSLGF